MANPSKPEKVIGIRVKKIQPDSQLEFSTAEIPEATLAAMTRSCLKPILCMKQIEKLQRNFLTHDDFAAILDLDLLKLMKKKI